MHLIIEAYKREIDRTLIRENLKLSVTERFERLMALQRFAEELQRAGRKAHPPDAYPLLSAFICGYLTGSSDNTA